MGRTIRLHFIVAIILFGLSMIGCSRSEELIDDVKPIDNTIVDDKPSLYGLVFLEKDNTLVLINDIKCDILDSVVECFIPSMMDHKDLIPQLTFNGEKVFFNETLYEGGIYNFDKPVSIKITKGKTSKEYMLYVHTFTGLPMLWVETENRQPIVSKEEYLKASFKLVDNVATRAAGDVLNATGEIRGRGNTSWEREDIPKKQFRIKLSEKLSLLGEPADKSWVLISNYLDKTMLRNMMAFYISSLSNLDYTPRSHFVELILNGHYWGTYQLCEKLKISKHRVNVGNDGFLLELDSGAERSGNPYVKTPHLPFPVCIKDPDVQTGDENYLYVQDFLNRIDSILYSDDFKNPNTGWQSVIDMDSFVEWYLVNEITKNIDARFASSCYMNFIKGNKLKMGPVWDFDVAFGNRKWLDCDPEGFIILDPETTWIFRLFEDPVFVERVKQRFALFYEHKDSLISLINSYARYLQHSVVENDNKWHVLYNEKYLNYNIFGSYENEVHYIKQWLDDRFEWLNANIYTL